MMPLVLGMCALSAPHARKFHHHRARMNNLPGALYAFMRFTFGAQAAS